MSNPVRQAAILRLVRDNAISTQGELVEALRDEGHDVVQTTVSRDVHELGLVKVRAPSGRLVYASPGTDDADRRRAIGVAMRRYATGVERAGPLVVVSTPSGYASALAQAIDEGGHPGIAGTIAGDNTIFLAPREGTTAAALGDELREHLASQLSARRSLEVRPDVSTPRVLGDRGRKGGSPPGRPGSARSVERSRHARAGQVWSSPEKRNDRWGAVVSVMLGRVGAMEIGGCGRISLPLSSDLPRNEQRCSSQGSASLEPSPQKL